MKVDKLEKLNYLEKMIQSYEKNHEKKYFIEQYLRGAGNELSGKFWELRSSSRMAYDLYSWMKNSENVLDFEFEYQLPNLKSGSIGPNMDVYIETKDELIFIESKFTEKANLHYIDNNYLKKAYYADEDYGRNNMSLVERFYGNEWAKDFSEFCNKWEDIMKANNWHNGIDWFEPKQETCHLSGILLYLFKPENKAKIKNKNIKLNNIYWKMPEDIVSEMEQQFCKQAQNLIDKIMTKYNPSIDFKIDAFSVQDMLADNPKLSEHIVFPENFIDVITKRNEEILTKEKITKR